MDRITQAPTPPCPWGVLPRSFDNHLAHIVLSQTNRSFFLAEPSAHVSNLPAGTHLDAMVSTLLAIVDSSSKTTPTSSIIKGCHVPLHSPVPLRQRPSSPVDNTEFPIDDVSSPLSRMYPSPAKKKKETVLESSLRRAFGSSFVAAPNVSKKRRQPRDRSTSPSASSSSETAVTVERDTDENVNVKVAPRRNKNRTPLKCVTNTASQDNTFTVSPTKPRTVSTVSCILKNMNRLTQSSPRGKM